MGGHSFFVFAQRLNVIPFPCSPLLPIMIQFLTTRKIAARMVPRDRSLGPLETNVMNVIWSRGESTVSDVVGSLEKNLAYTTIMTTLGRLFKKGLLNRIKINRAFAYSAAVSHQEWERREAASLIAEFLAGPNPSGELLISCLLDAVCDHDVDLLVELEKKIRAKRIELSRGTKA
jgi:predicted transcriptional regulator